MEQYIIKGGIPLNGEVEIGGAKNAALAILAAANMTDETVRIENLPDVRDINALLEAMQDIGARVERLDRHTVTVNGSCVENCIVENENMKKFVRLIIFLAHFLENTREQKSRFREAATLEAVLSISI